LLLDKESVSSADWVDIRGRCRTSTDAPRYAAMICGSRKNGSRGVVGPNLLAAHVPGLVICEEGDLSAYQ
jgi:hypothetical protein